MKPFRDYELRNVIANQWAAVHKKIDGMSNDETAWHGKASEDLLEEENEKLMKLLALNWYP